jgi:hypothetical protein
MRHWLLLAKTSCVDSG